MHNQRDAEADAANVVVGAGAVAIAALSTLHTASTVYIDVLRQVC